MPTSVYESKKIGGYDSWKVRDAVESLKKADEIKADPKFLKVVLKEMDREIDRTEETVVNLKKTSARLKYRKKK